MSNTTVVKNIVNLQTQLGIALVLLLNEPVSSAKAEDSLRLEHLDTTNTLCSDASDCTAQLQSKCSQVTSKRKGVRCTLAQ